VGCWIAACPPRRKISLPWFRQASLGERLTRLRLPRQHTLDCPPPHDTGSGGGPSGHAPWPKSAPTYAERFRYSRKAMSGSASVEVSWICNKESFEKIWSVADPSPRQILYPGFELQDVLFTFWSIDYPVRQTLWNLEILLIILWTSMKVIKKSCRKKPLV
jgi:hypothetical protein